ncbi:unnamed protein product, partial [Staurois parvus]
PSSAPTCAQQCHLPVPRISATSQCPAVVPVSGQQLRQSMPSSAASQCPEVMPVSATYQCCLSVPIISAAYQCCLSVPPIRATSLVLPISAAYPCHLIS